MPLGRGKGGWIQHAILLVEVVPVQQPDHFDLDDLGTRAILTAMSDHIERRSIAAQLADRVESEILAGTWTNELPGKRTLAERYGLNVKTCAAAIVLLEQRGIISAASAGRSRKILSRASKRSVARKSDFRLLVIHPSGGILNVEDYHLLQKMGESWSRIHGEVAWTDVDFARCKSPASVLDALVKRHAVGALLLYMPGAGWGRAAAARLPYYQTGGPFEADVPVSLGACAIDIEIKRAVRILRDLGHRRILVPTEGMGERMWKAVVGGLREGGGPKPEIGSWEDYCPQFPERVPEAWPGYWRKAFARLKPTAVLVFEDAHLLSLYGYCFTSGLKIPGDLSVMSQNYEPRFEWLSPKPVMMRYPGSLAIAHFQQWIDGGLKPIGVKFFPLDLVDGQSLARLA